MTDSADFGRFFLPGPTEVPPDLFEAMRKPVIGHRSAELTELMQQLQPALSALFETRRPVYVSTSSATGMMEAAITNLTRERVLCLECGAFGHRFHEIARATGRASDRLEAPWGSPNLPEELHEVLEREPGRYDLVTVVHSESSTGVLNPLGELSAVVRGFPDVLLAVDAVSSLAAAPVRTDAWGLDFVLTGSQKAVALPPGLALAVASERALERARRLEARGYYFDLVGFEKNLVERYQTPNTPAVSLLYALESQTARILTEGLEARWDRHAGMAHRTHEWVSEAAERTGREYRVLAPEGFRSPALTVIMCPDGVTGAGIVSRARERGFIIASGYGKLKESAFRIGHMGEHTMDDLEALLGVLDGILDEVS